MIKIILLVLACLVIVFLIAVATRPSESIVSRSVTVEAPPAVVFGHIADLEKFQEWSPWAKVDPTMKTQLNGPPDAVGSSYSWQADKMGVGSMIFTGKRPAEEVNYRLEFKKPFEATNQVTFTTKPAGNGTAVTWQMTGRNNFVFKAMGIFVNFEEMCGKDFDKGLANLKKLSESSNQTTQQP